MNFLTKIEDFINFLIIRLGELTVQLMRRITPPKVKALLLKIKAVAIYVNANFKQLPQTIKAFLINKFQSAKTELLAVDYKGKLIASMDFLKTYYKAQSAKGANKFKTLLMAPIVLVKQWLQGLSFIESTVLVAFTFASFFAGIGIFSTGHKVITQNSEADRSPASSEEVVYERPDYYKKDSRHVMITNIRLPVYFAEVNDLRTVDIDFNVTLSNRESRMKLEKLEFQLRDFLIIHTEPLLASFPLEEEGREIVKRKLWLEIDNFMKERGIVGHVQELKITYVLAN